MENIRKRNCSLIKRKKKTDRRRLGLNNSIYSEKKIINYFFVLLVFENEIMSFR